MESRSNKGFPPWYSCIRISEWGVGGGGDGVSFSLNQAPGTQVSLRKVSGVRLR